jgi:hypothetical protein
MVTNAETSGARAATSSEPCWWANSGIRSWNAVPTKNDVTPGLPAENLAGLPKQARMLGGAPRAPNDAEGPVSAAG